MNLLKRLLVEEDGLGTVELVLILAALVSIAIMFKSQIMKFVKTNSGKIFNTAEGGAGTDTSTDY